MEWREMEVVTSSWHRPRHKKCVVSDIVMTDLELMGPLEHDGKMAQPATFNMFKFRFLFVGEDRKCPIHPVSSPWKQSESRRMKKYFFGFIQPGCSILHFPSYYGMLCCHSKKVMPHQLVCCETERVLEQVQREVGLQLVFFFSFWLIKMLEGPALGDTMTGENQLLYPLLLVG